MGLFHSCMKPKNKVGIAPEAGTPHKSHADGELRAMRILEYCTEDDTEIEKVAEIKEQLGKDSVLTKVAKGGLAFNVLVNSDNQVVSFSGRPKIPPIRSSNRPNPLVARPMTATERPESSAGVPVEENNSAPVMIKCINPISAKVDHAKEDIKKVDEVRTRHEEALEKVKEEKEKLHLEKQKRAKLRREEMMQMDKEKAEKRRQRREERKKRQHDESLKIVDEKEQMHLEKQRKAQLRREEKMKMELDKAEKKQQEREEKKRRYDKSMEGVVKETQEPPISLRYLPPKTLRPLGLPDVNI